MRILSLALTISLVAAAAALAAQPKTPAEFIGGDGAGTPVTFKLNKSGKAKEAAVAYRCKGANGQNLALSKKPRGRVQGDGTLVIRFRVKDEIHGRLRVRFKVTFPRRDKAKGRVTFRNRKCKAKAVDFTADLR